ncbi:MAG: SUMF1/EgtB/PvdO family nonheme iron enzyme [Pseudomonadota bacterium]
MNLFIIIALLSVFAGIGLLAWMIDAGVDDNKKAFIQYGLYGMLACVFGLFFLIDDGTEFEYGYEKQKKDGGGGEQTRQETVGGEGGGGKTTVIIEDEGGDGLEGSSMDVTMVDSEGAAGGGLGVKADADCPECPEIVMIKPGNALIGSPVPIVMGGLSTAPAANITLKRAYGIGKSEITVAQFKAFVTETGYRPSSQCRIGRKVVGGRTFENPGFMQEDDFPAVCVSWTDAQKYTEWLSQKTSRTYRLPTEIEWEFAARSGVTGEYTTGPVITGGDANFKDPNGRPPISTVNTGQYAPNYNGMYDVHGNAWEFTADCWSPQYYKHGASTAGDGTDCSKRIVKGGGWFSSPDQLNLAMRASITSGSASNGIGFRVVRVGSKPKPTMKYRDLRGQANGREAAGLTSSSTKSGLREGANGQSGSVGQAGAGQSGGGRGRAGTGSGNGGAGLGSSRGVSSRDTSRTENAAQGLGQAVSRIGR